jgi:hypothetical protein
MDVPSLPFFVYLSEGAQGAVGETLQLTRSAALTPVFKDWIKSAGQSAWGQVLNFSANLLKLEAPLFYREKRN